jgi:PPP family 3-phenylpropionic acid transporter
MPYWRLSGFYFFYFATLGVLVPYWGLYLKSVGYSPQDIGTLIALLMLTRIVAPLVWGWIADHRARRMSVVRAASFFTAVVFIGVFFGTQFWWLALVMLAFSFFWHASLPLVEVSTMNHLGAQPGAYGRVRLWGSIGFIISVTALGALIDRHGPWWVLPGLLVLMTGIWLYSLALPESEFKVHVAHPQPFLRTIMRPDVFAFLLACFLMQVSHGPYYTFYSIYLEAHGYSKSVIGLLWAFAVVCEIGVFLLMQRLLLRVALRPVLLASFFLAAARWLLIGYFPQHLWVLILAQVLHAATFGSFHATAMQMVHRFFTGRHQHRGQAIYGSASFGIGGAVGSYYSGLTWESLGPAATFAIAAGAAAMAFVVAYFLLRPQRPG